MSLPRTWHLSLVPSVSDLPPSGFLINISIFFSQLRRGEHRQTVRSTLVSSTPAYYAEAAKAASKAHAKDKAPAGAAGRIAFHERLFALLLRYKSIQGEEPCTLHPDVTRRFVWESVVISFLTPLPPSYSPRRTVRLTPLPPSYSPRRSVRLTPLPPSYSPRRSLSMPPNTRRSKDPCCSPGISLQNVLLIELSQI